MNGISDGIDLPQRLTDVGRLFIFTDQTQMIHPIHIPFNGNHPSQPQVIVFNAGIQVVVRNHEGEVRRLYYFHKTKRDFSGKTVYFYAHTPSVPYEFESCWDVRSNLYLSEGFIMSEYKADGLDRIIYQYCLFELEISASEKTIRGESLVKSSNFSRYVDQPFVTDLIGQALSLSVASTDAAGPKIKIVSRKMSNHDEWVRWKSANGAVSRLNFNGQEIGMVEMKDSLQERLADTAYESFPAHNQKIVL